MKRLMRTMTAGLLAMALLFSNAVAVFAEEEVVAVTIAAPAETVYEVGDETNGFTVSDVRTFDLVGADVVTLVHDATGAQVMLVMNEDTNRSFDITFRTVAENNSGTPHVFEHATLDGSSKYPSKELFFNLSYQTYNTYMNASTFPYMTTYPIASLSEDQLLKYADYYLDSCFNPIIYEDESIFEEEAWRYVLADADDDLTVTGTVYNEMQGSYTIESAAYFNSLRSIYPGSTIGNVSGGYPYDIPNMTWEEVCNYHDKYYHPSNSLTVIYGKLENPSIFLALLNEVFSGYEKADFSETFVDADYEALEESVVNYYEYGVEAGSSTENETIAYYTYLCAGADNDMKSKLDLLTTLLGDDSSVFMQRMRNELPHATAYCYVETSGPDASVSFEADFINEDEVETFAAIVEESVAEIIENGFDLSAAEAVASSYRLSTLLSMESDEVGVNLSESIASYWVLTGDLYAYLDYVNILDNFTTWTEDGTFVDVMSQYMTDDAIVSVAVTSPVPGLKEEQDAAFAEALAEAKAEMSEEEIAEIVDKTLNSEESDVDTASMVQELTAVTVDSLPEEARIYDITDEIGDDGIRRIVVSADADGVGTSVLRFSMNGLSQDQLLWAKLYIDMLGELDSENYSQSELSSLMTRYFYVPTFRVSVANDDSEAGYTPYFHINFSALNDDLEAAYELINELLFASDLTNVEGLTNSIASILNEVKQENNADGLSVELYRLFGAEDPAYALYNSMNFLDYYDFLCEAQALMEEDPDTVIAELTAVQEYFRTQSLGTISAYIGAEEGAVVNAEAADAFLAELGGGEYEVCTYEFEEFPASEGLITNTNTSFNIAFASWENMGVEDGYTADWDVICSYISDQYLMPILRDERGAYGAGIYAGDYGIYIYSYRDPQVTDTLVTYTELGDMLAEAVDVSQETIDGYILSNYSYYAKSSGELTDGLSVLKDYLNGKSQEEKLEAMESLKSVAAEDLTSYAEAIGNIMANGRYATVSSASIINANADIYERVLNPFGVEDTSDVSINDVSEDDPNYDAIRFVFESGYMFLDEDGNFNPEGDMTLGDLAVPMSLYVGGDSDPAAAIEFLAGYGILPNEAPETVLTREDMVECLSYYYLALGGEIEDNELPDYPDSADVSSDLADLWSWCLENEIISPDEDGNLNPQATATRAEGAASILVFFGE